MERRIESLLIKKEAFPSSQFWGSQTTFYLPFSIASTKNPLFFFFFFFFSFFSKGELDDTRLIYKFENNNVQTC